MLAIPSIPPATGVRTVRELEFRDHIIWLYLGHPARQRGQIVARLDAAPDHPDLHALEETVGRRFERACHVSNVFVDHDLLNVGLGIELYAELGRIAAQRFEVPIVSMACALSRSCRPEDAPISPAARRLWSSRRLADRMVVRGLAAWGGNPNFTQEPT